MTLSGPSRRRPRAASGFSLVELLVVVGIIAIISAVGAPAISGYLRTYKIRGAAQEVATEIQTARTRGIMKNVNLGTVFVIVSPTTYRWVIEDDQVPPIVGMRQTMTALLAGCPDNGCGQAGPLKTLPPGVTFATTSPTVQGVRFNRLGMMCMPTGTAEPCPELAYGTNMLVFDANGQATLTLQQSPSNLKIALTIVPGGRILWTRSWQS